MFGDQLHSRDVAVLLLFVLCNFIKVTSAQEMDCYGPGSIAGAVLGTLICTLLFIFLVFYGYNYFLKSRREKHLVLQTDPEQGDKYAFDNPCFKDASGVGGLTPIAKALDKSGSRLLDTGKKWSQWSPLGAFVSTKNEKKRTLDDSHLESNEVKLVGLRSHDFTGLGFNICGNMRDGIFIKDVLHRGPASESGKLNPGDRINSVRISFEHMVYEDALTILSYASPYEVEIEAKNSVKGHQHGPPGSGGQGAQPKHPIYRSSSSSDLISIGKSRQRLFLNGDSKDASMVTDYSTLEKGKMSPRSDNNSLAKPERTKKIQNTSKHLSPEQLKSQLEQNLTQKIMNTIETQTSQKRQSKEHKIELEKQTTDADNSNKNRFQKFGVRVLPTEAKREDTPQNNTPKSFELSQNDNNTNQEKQLETESHPVVVVVSEGIDEVDRNKPIIRRREKTKMEEIPKENIKESSDTFDRETTLNSSGIKRDKSGIPQEIPDHMFNAAVAARKNRQSQEVIEKVVGNGIEEVNEAMKTPKKLKGKAPAPPPGTQTHDPSHSDNLDEINTLPETNVSSIVDVKTDNGELKTDSNKEYCSDSDMDADNQSSVNTIELNSSDITIHHSEQNNEMKGRKTASTGDLSKIQKDTNKPSTGTLERAQSLDITDSGVPTLTKKRKATKDDDSKLSSEESLYETSGLKVKEPRLSLTLEGMETFQRNRLKKSSEWGNLEDVIMNLDKVDAADDAIISAEDLIEEKIPIQFKFVPSDSLNLTTTATETVRRDDGEEEKMEKIVWPLDENDQNIPDSIRNELRNEKLRKSIPQIVDQQDKMLTSASQEAGTEEIKTSVYKSLWPVSDSEKYDAVKPSTFQQPDLVDGTFSLKSKLQEKLNSKLSQNPETDNAGSFHPGKSSQNFIFAEKYASNNDSFETIPCKLYDTNISDDIKVSRHSLGSLERPKSDVLKSVNKLKMQHLISSDQGGVSNILVTEASNENSANKSELNTVYDMSTASELYTTAFDATIIQNDLSESSADIKTITRTDKYLTDGPSSLTIDTSSDGPDSIKSNTLTFVTEIQVSTPTDKNISDIEVTASNSTKQSDTYNEQQRRTEEVLKKLPEMKFTTSSYESPRTPEKKLTQIELLRSNFEKSPSKSPSKTELSPSKSRIPVATKIDLKTSPKSGDGDNAEEKEMIEIMSSAVHSTPLVAHTKYTNRNLSKNVTVTSIKTSSKIPSGHSTYSNSKPPVPVRPSDNADLKAANGNTTDSTFKQWVFNPSENAVTNIVVNNNKAQF